MEKLDRLISDFESQLYIFFAVILLDTIHRCYRPDFLILLTYINEKDFIAATCVMCEFISGGPGGEGQRKNSWVRCRCGD